MKLYEEIKNLSDKYEEDTARNLSELIKLKSLSTKEKDVAFAVKSMMEQANFDKVWIDGMGNAIGKIGSGNRVIAIDGHIDTVDAGQINNWESNPFGGEIRDGFVYGRGSVDQKGGVAAFITSGKIIKELDLARDLTIYFTATVQEEDCDGLCWKYIIEEDRILPECVIITEPTDLNIYRGQRGRMEIKIDIRGVSSHGSMPDRGKNAIYMGAEIALKLEKLNAELINDEFLGKGTIALTEFKSSAPSLCAVSDFVQLHLDRRLTFGEDKDYAVSQVLDLVDKFDADVQVASYLEKSYTDLEYGMEKYYPTWKLEENHSLIQKTVLTYKKIFKSEPIIDKWNFSTNGTVINGFYNIPAFGFGPGDERLAHAPNEKVPIKHLNYAAAFYSYFCAEY
ncbi:YgeY family selenium metabolism-linked hydrolase [Bacteroidota bacterium]